MHLLLPGSPLLPFARTTCPASSGPPGAGSAVSRLAHLSDPYRSHLLDYPAVEGIPGKEGLSPEVTIGIITAIMG